MINLVLNKINDLINKSRGEYIQLNSGESRCFSSLKRYEEKEIVDFESKFDIVLPQEYKLFLTRVGACELYFDEFKLGIEFHELNKIQNLTVEIYNSIDTPFPTLLFIASNSGNGDFIGYNLDQGSDEFLTIFSIESDYTEDWININKFTSLYKFLDKLVASNGEDCFL